MPCPWASRPLPEHGVPADPTSAVRTIEVMMMSPQPAVAARAAGVNANATSATAKTHPHRAFTGPRLRPRADSRSLGQQIDLADDLVHEVGYVRHELAARHETEVERVEIALHGDVQTLPVD